MKSTPLILRLREAKDMIITVINSAIQEKELPCYLIEPIISEIHNQVSNAALKEYENAKRQNAETEAKKEEAEDGP